MTTQQFQRRSLELTPDQWASLEALAEAVGSIAPTGPNAGQPSWRSLIKRLANGGGFGSDTLTVTFNSNYSTEEGTSGQAGGSIGRQLIVRPRYNGTTKPVTWALA
jgi:hypothetical protein